VVDVVNPSVNFSIIGGLDDVYKQAQQQAQKDAALAQLRANPNMGYDQAARLLIGGGDVQSGGALAGIYNQIQQRALQEKQLAEQQRHSQATEGLGQQTLAETVRQHGVTDLQPVKLGSDLSGDIYGVRDPNAPGGYRRIDPSNLPMAGQAVPSASTAGHPAPMTGPRPGGPIPSSATVVGDKEAEARGLYEPTPLTPAQKAKLTGDAFLQTVPPDKQPLIKGLADYSINPSTVSTRTGDRARIIAAVKQYDPSYDENEYGQRSVTMKRFASGPQGDTLRSMNVGIDHLATLQDYADALKNGNVQVINRLGNAIKEQFGIADPSNFNAVKAIVGSEVSKAIVGSRGALADREELKKDLTAASSPAQLSGIIQAYKKLMSGQVRGLQQQYESSGLKDFNKKLLPATMKELGLSPDGTATASSGAASSGPVDWQTYFGPK
jgi:hypothetical protein